MTKTTDGKAPVRTGDTVVRACPDNQLKEKPSRPYSDTFSAEEVVMATFFPHK